MELRELQLEELKILKEALKIIKKHNLRYYMLGGTFLGAVRHKGFIPWDDDVDIGLPRDDYEKFCQFAKEELEVPYKISSYSIEENHNGYCSRVVNKNILLVRDDAVKEKSEYLWCDIFPLDGMPDCKIARKLHQFNLLFKRLLLQWSKIETGINMKKKRSGFEAFLIKLGFVVSKIFHFDVKKRLNAVDKCLRRYNYDKSKYVVNFMGAYKFKEMFPKALYDDSTLYDFEDIKLMAPKDFDKVLSQLYGDYIKPPAENQRFSHSIKIEEKNGR